MLKLTDSLLYCAVCHVCHVCHVCNVYALKVDSY